MHYQSFSFFIEENRTTIANFLMMLIILCKYVKKISEFTCNLTIQKKCIDLKLAYIVCILKELAKDVHRHLLHFLQRYVFLYLFHIHSSLVQARNYRSLKFKSPFQTQYHPSRNKIHSPSPANTFLITIKITTTHKILFFKTFIVKKNLFTDQFLS